MKSVFEYSDYKRFLRAWIEGQQGGGRGVRSRLAQALRCHTSYVTAILKGDSHLSPEQAEVVSRFIGQSDQEKLHLLLLVQKARAGTPQLREFLSEQIRKAVEGHLDFAKRVQVKRALGPEEQATYYSAWYYAAIHMALSVPELQTRAALARHFELPLNTVSSVLEFLASTQLARDEGSGRFALGEARLHLEKSSPLITRHHANWKVQTLRTLELPREEDLHYSSVVAVTRENELRIKTILVEAVEQVRSIVRESKEEEVYAYSIDFYPVARKR